MYCEEFGLRKANHCQDVRRNSSYHTIRLRMYISSFSISTPWIFVCRKQKSFSNQKFSRSSDWNLTAFRVWYGVDHHAHHALMSYLFTVQYIIIKCGQSSIVSKLFIMIFSYTLIQSCPPTTFSNYLRKPLIMVVSL